MLALFFWFIILIKGSLILNTLIYAKLPVNAEFNAQLLFHILLFPCGKIG